MTSPGPLAEIDAAGATEWRQLGRWLWAGRRDGRPVGTIERGRRFVLTDAAGEVLGAYRSFADAAAAAERPEPVEALDAAPRHSAVTSLVTATVVLGGGVAMGAGALAVLASV